MPVNEQTNQELHKKLPIDADEKVLAIFKHHWFAYVSIWIVTLAIVFCIFGLAYLLTSGADSSVATYRGEILAGAGLFSCFIILAGIVPVYLRSKEQLVLTEEALLQVLQPTIFSSKVDQLSLQHVTDVAVHQDFFGTMFGYGKVTVETPGEQNNYDFSAVPDPQAAARQISAAHENFDAALQGGRLGSTLGVASTPGPQIDMAEYQEFLEFQKMREKQRAGSTGNDSAGPQAGQ
jgi:hypothetical protein